MIKVSMLFIFVEGDDDETFFDSILSVYFELKYKNILTIQYSSKSKKDLKKLFNAVISTKSEYLILGDYDSGPCISKRKNEIRNRFDNQKLKNIYIVVKEIESWYLAGLDDICFSSLGINPPKRPTETIGKGIFKKIVANSRFLNTKDFMMEIIKYYNLNEGKENNSSLEYFCISQKI